ncbi:MAG: AI-2E family transporter [Chitinispirillaceae bacterium]|nr:AI-2E family transporter [Chitinispirillaceae bacterium]
MQRGAVNQIIRCGFYLLVAMVTVVILYSIKILFFPLVIALLLKFLLQPAVNFLETRGMRRLTALITLYLIIITVAGAALFIVMPLLMKEARNFSAHLPLYDKMLEGALVKVRELILQKFPSAAVPDFYALVHGFFEAKSAHLIESLPHYVSTAASMLSIAAIVPVIAFFYLADGHLIQKALLRLAPNRYFEMFVLLSDKILGAVQAFIRGQLIDALSVGVMTSIGLALIGLPYFLVIGIIAGLGNLIPYLGPVIGFIPAFIVILVSPLGFSALGLLKVIIVFVTVQFIEGTFIYPLAVGKSVNLHPLVVIVGVTIGGMIGGIVGMLIIIPMICVVKVTLEVMYSYLKQYSII